VTRDPCRNADGSSKLTYRTRADARLAARETRTRARRRGDKGAIRAYHCPAGEHWHVGHGTEWHDARPPAAPPPE
jgi:hypothetical protein